MSWKVGLYGWRDSRARSCVGWRVTLCYHIWQEMSWGSWRLVTERSRTWTMKRGCHVWGLVVSSVIITQLQIYRKIWDTCYGNSAVYFKCRLTAKLQLKRAINIMYDVGLCTSSLTKKAHLNCSIFLDRSPVALFDAPKEPYI